MKLGVIELFNIVVFDGLRVTVISIVSLTSPARLSVETNTHVLVLA